MEISNKVKLVTLGESGVGKSSLILQAVKGQFHEVPMPTIGAAFLNKEVKLEGEKEVNVEGGKEVMMQGEKVEFDIWDTVGQERFHSILPLYYRGANAAIIVYNITKRDTFERAKEWVEELERNTSKDIVIAFIGNKVDLAESRNVTYDEVKTYAEDNQLILMETSAKTALNVDNMFLSIAKKLPRKKVSTSSDIEHVKLSNNKHRQACCNNKE